VRCARINALLNQTSIDVREGDLFRPVVGEQFDLILFNPPYLAGQPKNALDQAFRAPRIAERFASQLTDHLTADGYALLLLSSIGEDARFLAACTATGLRIAPLRQKDLRSEVVTLYRIDKNR
jgi:release factor glutamine methyltransferase